MGHGMLYDVYILNCADGSLYTGVTNDLEKRLAAHNSGKGAKYTRSRLPVAIAYREACGDRSAALRREFAIRRMTREGKLRLIAGLGSGVGDEVIGTDAGEGADADASEATDADAGEGAMPGGA